MKKYSAKQGFIALPFLVIMLATIGLISSFSYCLKTNNRSLELLTEDRDNLKEEIYYVSLLKCELIKYNNLDNLISNGFRISKIDNGYLLEGDDFLLIIRTEGNMIVDYEFKR